MSLEQCTSLQGMAADYSLTSSWDTNQLSLLSGMDMPAKSLENEQQTDGSQACECGKGTLGCSIHPSTPEAWTAFMRDSLAKILASLESKQAYLREPDQVFTEKSCASLAWYDQSCCSWKTYQQSLVTDWEPYSETWPRWGMTQGGSAFVHPMSERTIKETGGSYWQTPTVSCAEHPGQVKHKPGQQLRLPQQVNNPKYWPAPTVDSASIQRRAAIGKQLNLSMVVSETSGALNPQWVEWLMGFPIGFTVSKDWVTPRFHCKQPQPTDCSEATK